MVAAVAALADRTTHLHGIGHIRGHETDRLAALATELERLGGHVNENHDGLTIHPRMLGGAEWRTYADHRMAQAGALLGLVVPEVTLDDIGCTAKTMPEFADLWQAMISSSQVDAVPMSSHGDEHAAFDRPGRRSRPRTKDRPAYADAEPGMVVTVDRGRFTVLVGDREVSAVKARQLGRTGVIVGDRVSLVGDHLG